MKWLTEDAIILCKHVLGKVIIIPLQQDLVTIEGRKVLIEHDPEMKPIVGCPNIGATIKPCLLTQKVDAGYSDFLRINGHPICLDTVTGLTDGTPPGLVKYAVNVAGQDLVTEVP